MKGSSVEGKWLHDRFEQAQRAEPLLNHSADHHLSQTKSPTGKVYYRDSPEIVRCASNEYLITHQAKSDASFDFFDQLRAQICQARLRFDEPLLSDLIDQARNLGSVYPYQSELDDAEEFLYDSLN